MLIKTRWFSNLISIKKLSSRNSNNKAINSWLRKLKEDQKE